MQAKQQNQLTMYLAVLRYLEEAGAPLARVTLIGQARTALATVVAAIKATQRAQSHDTSGTVLTRRALKQAAAGKAEVLRLLVVTLSADAGLRAELRETVKQVLKGKDAVALAYLRKIEAAIGTVPAEALADAGYEAAVRLELRQNVERLTATQGQARQIRVGISAATDTLPGLFGQATKVLEKQLDPLVGAQQLKRPALVAQYKVSRRIVQTAARRTVRYRGVVQYGQPALVVDRREAGVPQPTLGNRSGKGLTLRYYTAMTSTAAPLPGQGVVVKPRGRQQLADYGRLGDGDAPYLLVVLEQVDGEGRWVVK